MRCATITLCWLSVAVLLTPSVRSGPPLPLVSEMPPETVEDDSWRSTPEPEGPPERVVDGSSGSEQEQRPWRLEATTEVNVSFHGEPEPFGITLVTITNKTHFHHFIVGVAMRGLAEALSLSRGDELLALNLLDLTTASSETLSDAFRNINESEEFELYIRSQRNSSCQSGWTCLAEELTHVPYTEFKYTYQLCIFGDNLQLTGRSTDDVPHPGENSPDEEGAGVGNVSDPGQDNPGGGEAVLASLYGTPSRAQRSVDDLEALVLYYKSVSGSSNQLDSPAQPMNVRSVEYPDLFMCHNSEDVFPCAGESDDHKRLDRIVILTFSPFAVNALLYSPDEDELVEAKITGVEMQKIGLHSKNNCQPFYFLPRAISASANRYRFKSAAMPKKYLALHMNGISLEDDVSAETEFELIFDGAIDFNQAGLACN